MNDAFGDQLREKVDCIGLHGDYEAGLQFIRDGKLDTFRVIPSDRLSHLDAVFDNEANVSDSAVMHPVTPPFKPELSPVFQPFPESLITPGTEVSALSGVMTDDEVSMGGTRSGGSWSPIEGEGTYFPSPQTLPSEFRSSRPLHLVFLGSSLGNFPREDAAPFLRSLPLRHGDTFLLGLDGRPVRGSEGRRKVEMAYNDPAGHTRAFEEHGWDVVRDELSIKHDVGVDFVGRYNEILGEWLRHIIDPC